MNRSLFLSSLCLCWVFQSPGAAGESQPIRRQRRHRAASGGRGAGHGYQQFQGGPSGTVSAGNGRRAYSSAGAERDRRGQSRCIPPGAGAIAGHGRVVEINARLGDEVKKGQLLFKVRSTDIAGAFSDYRKAVKNEQLAKIQLDRAKLLFDNGAIPKSALEIAQNAEDDAMVDLETTKEHLRLLGVRSGPSNRDRRSLRSGFGSDHRPADHQLVGRAGTTAPNPFTISDLSTSGSFATCTRTIWRRFTWENMRISV